MELIEEQQEKIKELHEHFTEYVEKRNYPNDQFVVDRQKQVINTFRNQLKALIDIPEETSNSLKPSNVKTLKNNDASEKSKVEATSVPITLKKEGERKLEKSDGKGSTTIDAKSKALANNEPTKKKRKCRFFIQGHCKKGDQCNQLHEMPVSSSLKTNENQSIPLDGTSKVDESKVTTGQKRNANQSSDSSVPNKVVKEDAKYDKSVRDITFVLMIYNLDPEWNSGRFKHYLKRNCGEVAWCEVLRDNCTLKSLGEVEVKFNTIEGENKALNNILRIGRDELTVVVKGAYFLRLLVTGVPHIASKAMLRQYFSQFATINDITRVSSGQFYVDLQIPYKADKVYITCKEHIIQGEKVALTIEIEEDIEKLKQMRESPSGQCPSSDSATLDAVQKDSNHFDKYIRETPVVLKLQNLPSNLPNDKTLKDLVKQSLVQSGGKLAHLQYLSRSAEVVFASIEGEKKILNKKLSIRNVNIHVAYKGGYLLMLLVTGAPLDAKDHHIKKYFSKFGDVTYIKKDSLNIFVMLQISSPSDKGRLMSKDHALLSRKITLEIKAEGDINMLRKTKQENPKKHNYEISSDKNPGSDGGISGNGNIISNYYSLTPTPDSRARYKSAPYLGSTIGSTRSSFW